ncbi:winged helix-turn-helix domain-containing protein [Pseudomonas paracarnis]|uniref:winged helix-turn-helix domain-containing protein n=1 Tax=Pseudomonas paracarnis TaxID=2750625 RepID=UPI002FE1529F
MHFSNILAIARTRSKARDLSELIAQAASKNLTVNTHSYGQLIDPYESYGYYPATIIEIDIPSASTQVLDIIKKIKSNNPSNTIFLVATFAATLSKTKYYFAGADYCIKVADRSYKKKLSLFSALLIEIHWLSKTDLILDQDRMYIHGGGKKLEVSYVEMKVLESLTHNRLLRYDEVAEIMGLSIQFYDSRALEKSISRLRGKIKSHYGINIIQSVRGYGYKLIRGFYLVKHTQPIKE